MPNVLISGPQGFIGSKLYSYLEEKGYNVLGLDEDIRNKQSIRPYFINTDFVVHTAGETQRIDDEEACHSTNVVGTQNIIDWCMKYNCKLIHLSSTARKTAYGKSKQESQKLVEDADLKRVVLRLCPIVRMNDPLMVWGRRYPVENLVEDIEKIIRTHNFDKFELIDYKKFKGPQ